MIKSFGRVAGIGLMMMFVGVVGASAAPKQIDPTASRGVGFYGTSPSIKFWINNEMAVQAGGHVITSSTAGAATEIILGTAFQFATGPVLKNVQPHWVGFFQYDLNKDLVNGVNILSIGGGWGVDVFITPRFTAGFDMALITLNSISAPAGAGGTSFSFISPTMTGHYYF